jgi:hypothetical protein
MPSSFAALTALFILAPALAAPPFSLQFLPSPSDNGFRNASLWSWGGGTLLVDGTYHLFASAFTSGCGLGAWTTNSIAIHAISPSALGPFSFVSRALPYYHHNVQPILAPDGTFLIFAIGMVPDPAPKRCAPGEPGAVPPLEHGFESTEVWFAPTVDGPWSPVEVAGSNGRNIFNSTNPSPFFHPSGNGTIVVMGHVPDVTVFHVSVAPSWRGPYSAPRPVFDTESGGYTGEDPFLWYDAQIPNGEGGLGAWRCLYHMYNKTDPRHQYRVGGYAQSAGPDIFGAWEVQPNETPAYTADFTTYVSGSAGPTQTTTLARRERPKLFRDPATGAPSVLYSGACAAASGNDCFTIAAPIAMGAAA